MDRAPVPWSAPPDGPGTPHHYPNKWSDREDRYQDPDSRRQGNPVGSSEVELDDTDLRSRAAKRAEEFVAAAMDQARYHDAQGDEDAMLAPLDAASDWAIVAAVARKNHPGVLIVDRDGIVAGVGIDTRPARLIVGTPPAHAA